MGPVQGLLNGEDRIAARFMFERLLRQYQRHSERNAYCASHPEDAEADERARTSSRRFAELRDELIAWADADPGAFIDLFGEVVSLAAGQDTPRPAEAAR